MARHITKYVVTYIEYGDSVDGRPRALGIYDMKEEAEKAIKEDMETYAESLGMFYEEDWCVWASPEEKWVNGCAWNISEIAA